MKIATWNVNSIKVRLPQLLDWLKADQPDVVALQETKTINENFPEADIKAAGYHVAFSGQKTYNGVAILSRMPLQVVENKMDHFPDPQQRFLAATINGVRVINVYVPNGASVDSEKYAYKLAWLEGLQHYLETQLKQYEQVVVLGDFNIAPEDRDVHDPVAWEGNVLVSPPERNALNALMQAGLHDTFRLFSEANDAFSWWDYRKGAFHRNHGLRIDLVLISKDLIPRCQQCVIEREMRKHERPSDHVPVWVEFNLK